MENDDRHSALLLVDVQRDFCPGGALGVPNGDRVVPVLNRYAAEADRRGMTVYATRDWHPAVTNHFKQYGGPWPPHCVQNTAGAEFHPDLRLPASAVIVSKGQNPERPGYSAFDGTTGDGHLLVEDLRRRKIDTLYIGGLATDYCVRESVRDARQAGFDVTVLDDGIAGIDVKPGDIERAMGEIRSAGAHETTFEQWTGTDAR
jgi:nicotinamidase/pyrazinamidase